MSLIPYQYANDNGYAVIAINTTAIAMDDLSRTGAFYELYQYTDDIFTQTGTLMAWGWGGGKVTMPVCSGAGGIALYRYKSQGNVCDYTTIGGRSDTTMGGNEHIGSLKNNGTSSAAQKVFEYMGVPDSIAVGFHKETHGVIQEDLEKLFAYCNYYFYGIESPVDLNTLKTTLYGDIESNRYPDLYELVGE